MGSWASDKAPVQMEVGGREGNEIRDWLYDWIYQISQYIKDQGSYIFFTIGQGSHIKKEENCHETYGEVKMEISVWSPVFNKSV